MKATEKKIKCKTEFWWHYLWIMPKTSLFLDLWITWAKNSHFIFLRSNLSKMHLFQSAVPWVLMNTASSKTTSTIREYFHNPLKFPQAPLYSILPCTPATTDLISVPLLLPFYTNGIIQHRAFYTWLLLFSIMYLRFVILLHILVHFLLFPNSMPFDGYTTVCLYIHWVKPLGTVFSWAIM